MRYPVQAMDLVKAVVRDGLDLEILIVGGHYRELTKVEKRAVEAKVKRMELGLERIREQLKIEKRGG